MINNVVEIIINEFVNSLLYSLRTFLAWADFSFNKCNSDWRFPIERNNDKKNGHKINQGLTLTSIANAPVIALITKKVAIDRISAKIIFFKKKV